MYCYLQPVSFLYLNSGSQLISDVELGKQKLAVIKVLDQVPSSFIEK